MVVEAAVRTCSVDVHARFPEVPGAVFNNSARCLFVVMGVDVVTGCPVGIQRPDKTTKSSSLSLSQWYHIGWISCARHSLLLMWPTDASSSQVLLLSIACGPHIAVG